MSLQIQSLSESDWQRYRQIRLSALLDAPEAFASSHAKESRFEHERWQKRLSGAQTIFTAISDDKHVGLVAYSALPDAPDHAGLFQMWVSPTYRKAGIGRRLVATVIENARSDGFQAITLDVADQNTGAIALYESFGFVPTGRVGAMPPPLEHIKEHERILMLESH